MADPDYESDEYYDEQGNRWYEPQYFPILESDPSEEDEDDSFDQTGCSYDGNKSCSDIRMEVIDFDTVSTDTFVPRPGYQPEEMTPTRRDPRCRSQTELARFWPVYVGNFRCQQSWQGEFDTVQKFFAWKGLHVRWWYRKVDDPYYSDFQSKAGLYDMLVYFVSEEDANFAIRNCHRTMFMGYPLNVFPGRTPVYFDPSRSLQAKKMKSGRVYSELFFEKHVKFIQGVDVTCTVKFDTKYGAMEFASPEDMAKVRKGEKLWKFEPVPRRLRKQRFLEKDLLAQIEAHLLLHPDTLRLDPNDSYAKMLLQNKRPQLDPNPKIPPVPLRNGPTKRVQQTKLKRKMKKEERRITQAVAEGHRPKCYGKTVEAKKRFKKMLESAVKNHERDDC